MSKGKRFWVGVLLATCAGVAFAGGTGSVRKQIESSLLVKGTIDISADGAVVGHALEPAAALTPGIVGVIERTVARWRFEPVKLNEGTTRARAKMSLRIVANKLDGGGFAAQIRGAHFGEDEDKPGESVTIKGSLTPPPYPDAAAYDGVGGTVYAVLKIGRDGRVEDAVAEQVNLRFVAGERAMTRWRDMFATAVVRKAKEWTFHPPTKGEDVDVPYWSVRVPVDFVVHGAKEPDQYDWQTYLPGPRQAIPWLPDQHAASRADAVAAGGVYPLDAGPRLLTALDPS